MIDFIIHIAIHLQRLSKKEFQQYCIAVLGGVAILALGASYYIYSASSTEVKKITQLNNTANKISSIIAQNKQLNDEEERITALLDKYPDFSMNSYFERFYTKHNLNPEPNWKPEEGAAIESSQEGISFQEITLQASFKNQTMEKLVQILQDIYKEEIIYLKALEITRENGKIGFDITLATKQYKKEAEGT